MIVDVSYFC